MKPSQRFLTMINTILLLVLVTGSAYAFDKRDADARSHLSEHPLASKYFHADHKSSHRQEARMFDNKKANFIKTNWRFIDTLRDDIVNRMNSVMYSVRFYTPKDPYQIGKIGDPNQVLPGKLELGIHFNTYLPDRISGGESKTGLETLNDNAISLFRNYDKSTIAMSTFSNSSDEGWSTSSAGQAVMQANQAIVFVPLYDLPGAIKGSWTWNGNEAPQSALEIGDTYYNSSTVTLPSGHSVEELYYQVSKPIEGLAGNPDLVMQDIFYRLRTNGTGKHGSLYGIMVIFVENY